MVALNRNTVGGFNAILEPMPVVIAPLDQLRDLLFALVDHAELRLVRRLINRAVQQGFVMHGTARFDPAGRGDDAFGFRIVDPHGQFMRRKATEHDRVDRAQTGTGQHRLKRLGHHRHVDNDAVALFDALGPQRTGQIGHAVA